MPLLCVLAFILLIVVNYCAAICRLYTRCLLRHNRFYYRLCSVLALLEECVILFCSNGEQLKSLAGTQLTVQIYLYEVSKTRNDYNIPSFSSTGHLL